MKVNFFFDNQIIFFCAKIGQWVQRYLTDMSNSLNFLPGVSVCLSRDFNNKWLPLSPHYKEKSKFYKLLLVDAYISLKPNNLEKKKHCSCSIQNLPVSSF